MGPSLARIMEQCHIREAITIIHMAAPTQNLIANDVYLVLDLGNPLAYDGEQLWDGGLRIKENLLARRVIGVEEGKSWRKKSRLTLGKLPPLRIMREF